MKKILSFIIFLIFIVPLLAWSDNVFNNGGIFNKGSSNGSSGFTITDGSNTVAGTTQLTVTGGTVGGTTPNATLSITGSGSAAGGTNAVQYNSGAATIAGKEQVFSMNGTNVGIGTTNGKSLLDVEGQAYFNGNVGIGTTNTSGGGLIVFNGNVGIGTTATVRTLEVASIGTSTGVEMNNLNGGKKWDFLSIGNGSTFNAGGGGLFNQTDSKMAIFADTSENVGIGTFLQSNLFEVGNQKLDVQSGGNVGIGSITPGQTLDVNGTIRGTTVQERGGTSSQFIKGDGPLDSSTYLTGTKADSVSNADGTLTISPTTGAVVASLALAHANTWTANQTISAANIPTDTTTGMKIGTATNQKIGFFNSTPIVQPSGDVLTALNASNLGLVASPSLAQADITGLTTASSPTFTGVTLSGLSASVPVFTTAGSALTTGTLSGNTTKLATSTGVLTSGHCVQLDASGNYIDAGSACGSGAGSNYWTLNGGAGNVGISTTGIAGQSTVGIGTIQGNGSLLVFGGNVGINTANPIQPLQVNGTGQVTNLIDTGVTASKVVVTSAGQQLTAASNLQDLAYCQSNGTNCPSSSGTNFWQLVAATGNVGISTANTVGIGTTQGNGALEVMNGNVGIGTVNPIGLLSIVGGNVSIGTSATASQLLDINKSQNTGTTLNLENDSSGASADSQVQFLNGSTGGDIGVNGTGNTSTVGAASGMYVAMAGSGGITFSANTGSFFWDAPYSTQIMELTSGGNLGIGTNIPKGALVVMSGNVGIGTWIPAQLVDIKGTAQMTGFSLPTGASSGFVLTSNGVGIGTWQAATGGGSGTVNSGTVTQCGYYASSSNVISGTSNCIVSGNDMQFSGNVGIGTTLTTSGAALTVMNGNVGIGTWKPTSELQVATIGNGISSFNNVGIGTTAPTGALEIEGGNVGIGTFLGGALVTLGGTAANSGSATVGPVVCLGLSANGIACLGKCTSISTDTCNCTCL